jgi:hypothetical protein
MPYKFMPGIPMTAIPRAARRLPAAGALCLALVAGPSMAQDGDREIENLVDRIIELRGDVEELDSRLQSLKKEHESRMSSLARREGELTSQREAQKLQIKKLEKKLADLREQVREAGVATEELEPVIVEAIDGMREYVRSSLPFKRGERLASLDELETQLKNDALEPPRVANRLWSFHADEIRLTSESGIFRQPIEIGGEERLVDVARLGMMMLYFRTDDEQYGYATNGANGWSFEYVDGSRQRDQVASLFDSLRKQIRTGYFQLPNPIEIPEAQ